MDSQNSKRSESHRFRLDLTDDLNIYYTWKNIKSEYNNNKFKISDPT